MATGGSTLCPTAGRPFSGKRYPGAIFVVQLLCECLPSSACGCGCGCGCAGGLITDNPPEKYMEIWKYEI